MKKEIQTTQAPQAIGTYSQAIRANDTVYLSGQIAINPETGTLENDSMDTQIDCIINNLSAICDAAGGTLSQIVKLTVYLTDLTHFEAVNTAMQQHFQTPYPARALVEVSALPKGVDIEIDAIMVVGS